MIVLTNEKILPILVEVSYYPNKSLFVKSAC